MILCYLRIVLLGISLELHHGANGDLTSGGRRFLFRLLLDRLVLFQKFLDGSAEGVHALAVFREPVHDIAVVGSDAALITFGMTDDVLLGQSELFAQVGAKLDGLLIHLLEVGAISEAVFADFKTDMGVVCAAACMPAAVIPRQRLVSGDAAVCQLADETMDAYLTTAGVVGVPMVVVLVLAQFAVIGSDIALQPRIVRAGAV